MGDNENTLAYYGTEFIAAVEIFIKQTLELWLNFNRLIINNYCCWGGYVNISLNHDKTSFLGLRLSKTFRPVTYDCKNTLARNVVPFTGLYFPTVVNYDSKTFIIFAL